MNKWTLGQVVAVIAIVALITTRTQRPAQVPAFKPDRANFKAGEILLPDYAHDDTLVVINPSGLNRDIDNCDGTDWEIAGALYRHCAVLGQEMPEYGLDVDNKGYILYDYAYKDSIHAKWGTHFDSLMYNWND